MASAMMAGGAPGWVGPRPCKVHGSWVARPSGGWPSRFSPTWWLVPRFSNAPVIVTGVAGDSGVEPDESPHVPPLDKVVELDLKRSRSHARDPRRIWACGPWGPILLQAYISCSCCRSCPCGSKLRQRSGARDAGSRCQMVAELLPFWWRTRGGGTDLRHSAAAAVFLGLAQPFAPCSITTRHLGGVRGGRLCPSPPVVGGLCPCRCRGPPCEVAYALPRVYLGRRPDPPSATSCGR
jgi:hypothetical protein